MNTIKLYAIVNSAGWYAGKPASNSYTHTGVSTVPSITKAALLYYYGTARDECTERDEKVKKLLFEPCKNSVKDAVDVWFLVNAEGRYLKHVPYNPHGWTAHTYTDRLDKAEIYLTRSLAQADKVKGETMKKMRMRLVKG